MADVATTAVSEAITRKSASNLALAFILLPEPKRRAMATLYAFCREIDDVADNDDRPVADRAADLQHWREDLSAIYAAREPQLPVNRELAPFIREYRLEFDLFDELIKGVEMDLEITRFATWNALEEYCYRVASVVGLLSIEVFGYSNPRCKEYAISLGLALQLTNILRDVSSDAVRDRIYLPQSELKRHGVAEIDVINGRHTPEYRAVAESVAQRARNHYQAARRSLPPEDRSSMASAELMGSVYWGLFQKLERKQFNVFDGKKTRLNKAEKMFLILRTWFRIRRGALQPNYGGS